MLEYSLHENQLTDRPDDYSAQPHSKISYNKEQFIDLMLQRGTLMTKTDALAVFNNMEETVVYIVKNGGTLNLPLFNTSFSMPGVYEGPTDVYDPHRHQIHINLQKGVLLREAEHQIKVVKVNAVSPQPQILEVKDSVSGKVDQILTPGGAVEVNGINIKIAGEHADCGLYFVDEYAIRHKAATIVVNKPATVIALIPQLKPGTYQVRIITQFTGGKEWKDPKTTSFGRLTVPTLPTE